VKTKPILCPERLRHLPAQFSWIDQRLVRHRHIQGRSPHALSLYLFLCVVADAQGLSYYSEPSAAKFLGFSLEQLRAARAELVHAALIAYRRPFYQVLSLEPYNAPAADPRLNSLPRSGQMLPLGELLRSILEKGQP
jgi:hypothetical protein